MLNPLENLRLRPLIVEDLLELDLSAEWLRVPFQRAAAPGRSSVKSSVIVWPHFYDYTSAHLLSLKEGVLRISI